MDIYFPWISIFHEYGYLFSMSMGIYFPWIPIFHEYGYLFSMDIYFP